MRGVPATALILALAGLLPFLWGAAMAVLPNPAALPLYRDMPAALRDEAVLVEYGIVILCFMSGVLWGFAARTARARAAAGYAASVVPALWAFFAVRGAGESALIALAAGFAGVLAIDWLFARAGLAPSWWMRLRVPVTVVVLACLGTGIVF